MIPEYMSTLYAFEWSDNVWRDYVIVRALCTSIYCTSNVNQ